LTFPIKTEALNTSHLEEVHSLQAISNMFEVKLKCGQLSVYNYDKVQIHCPTIQCKEWQKQELVIKGS